MSTNNQELAQEVISAWNDHNWDRFRELTTEDWVLHAEFRDEPIDRATYIDKEMKEVRASLFEDTNIQLEEFFDGGDHFTILYNRTGSVGEEYIGMEVSNDTFEHPGMITCRVTDGEVTEMWGVQDHGARLSDLGLVNEP